MLELDHLAVSGATVAEATEAVEAALGVSLQKGGEHAAFGTHNTLLGLADGLYLEAIAINPDAPAPNRPRWFDLDKRAGPPRLTNWICRTDDLPAMLTRFAGVGDALSLERGDFKWNMAVPLSGLLPYDNRFPALIQWHGAAHPAQRLEQRGCALRRLIVSHPDGDALERDLAEALCGDRVVFENGMSALRAEIVTPHGLRVLT